MLGPSGLALRQAWCLYEAWQTVQHKGAGGLVVLAPCVDYEALQVRMCGGRRARGADGNGVRGGEGCRV